MKTIVYKNLSFRPGYKPTQDQLKASHGKILNAKGLKDVHALLHAKDEEVETPKASKDGDAAGTTTESK